MIGMGRSPKRTMEARSTDTAQHDLGSNDDSIPDRPDTTQFGHPSWLCTSSLNILPTQYPVAQARAFPTPICPQFSGKWQYVCARVLTTKQKQNQM